LADDVVLTDETGRVVGFQVVAFRDDATHLGQLLRNCHWDAPVSPRRKVANEGRLTGIVVSHRTFGYRPPVPVRRRWECASCLFDGEQPEATALLGRFVSRADDLLAELAPDTRAAMVTRVTAPKAWRIGTTLWTSGVINNNAALPYHTDGGNVPGSWSAMLGVKRDCEGGWLHLADYDVWLTIPHGSITVFDGQGAMHGVSPFRLTRPGGYRFTAVVYARAGMKVCSPDPADEPARAALAATERASRPPIMPRDRSPVTTPPGSRVVHGT